MKYPPTEMEREAMRFKDACKNLEALWRPGDPVEVQAITDFDRDVHRRWLRKMAAVCLGRGEISQDDHDLVVAWTKGES